MSDKTVVVRIDAALKDRIRAVADGERRTLTAQTSVLLEEALNHRERLSGHFPRAQVQPSHNEVDA